MIDVHIESHMLCLALVFGPSKIWKVEDSGPWPLDGEVLDLALVFRIGSLNLALTLKIKDLFLDLVLRAKSLALALAFGPTCS